MNVSNAMKTRAAWSNFLIFLSEPFVSTPEIFQRHRNVNLSGGVRFNLWLKAEQVFVAMPCAKKFVPSRPAEYTDGVLKNATFSQPLVRPREKFSANKTFVSAAAQKRGAKLAKIKINFHMTRA